MATKEEIKAKLIGREATRVQRSVFTFGDLVSTLATMPLERRTEILEAFQKNQYHIGGQLIGARFAELAQEQAGQNIDQDLANNSLDLNELDNYL